MDLYENTYLSLRPGTKAKKTIEIEKYAKMGQNYAEQGFDKVSIAELLQIDKCDVDLSNKIAECVVDKMPVRYAIDNPPVSFMDVKDQVEETVKTANMDKVESYFKKYATKKYDDGIVQRIQKARVNNFKTAVAGVVSEIEPMVNDLIVASHIMANDKTASAPENEKENLELDLFGVWPTRLIQKRAGFDKADEKILKKVKILPGTNISFI
jgi:hypothetical protein